MPIPRAASTTAARIDFRNPGAGVAQNRQQGVQRERDDRRYSAPTPPIHRDGNQEAEEGRGSELFERRLPRQSPSVAKRLPADDCDT